MTTGTTPRSDTSTVTVIVTVVDVNDNDPVWTDPTPGPVTLVEVCTWDLAFRWNSLAYHDY